MRHTILLFTCLLLITFTPACKKPDASQETPVPTSTTQPAPTGSAAPKDTAKDAAQQPTPADSAAPKDTAQNTNTTPEAATQPPQPAKEDVHLTTSCTPSRSISPIEDSYDHEDGTYSHRTFVDSWVSYHIERRHKIEKDDPSLIVDMIKNMIKFEPRDFHIDVDQALTDRLKNKTYKITYIAGHNEDTSSNIDYYILGKDFDYRLHMSCAIDFVEEFGQPIMDELVHNLKFETN